MEAEVSASILGWSLETFATPFVDWLTNTLKDKAQQKKWEYFDWPKAEQAYLDKVIELYDCVRILGSSADVPLVGNIFTQVYILDKPTARQRYDIEELRKHGHERSQFQGQSGNRVHGMQLAKNRQNLFILGKPGAGKTTFLKYITIQAARKQLPQIPIFVSLNLWADSKWGKGENAALLPFIVDQFDICDFPEADLFIDYLLRKGQALLLFDGLDEVKQEDAQRHRLTHLLQVFARKYNKSKHLITCRIAANEYAFERFVDVEIADFTQEQIQEYARNWFGAQEKKFDAFVDELAKPVNQGLAELCNTPLLLSLLCLTFDNDMRFPPSRAELYEDALETLLRKWDSNRSIQRDEIYRELSHKRKLQLLMNIAVPTFQKGELFFRQRDLEKWIVDYLAKLPGAPPADTMDGTALLKAMEAQHSILVERAQGIYSFSHLTFQEYFTARYLAENQGKEETNGMIRRHLTDRRWNEVFLLTASLLNDAEAFVTVLRQATDNIAANEPLLIRLLAWTQKRTQAANTPVERRHTVQLAYIFLAFAKSFELAFESKVFRKQELTLALTLGRIRLLSTQSSLDFNLALERVIMSAKVYMGEIASESALVRMNSLARLTTPLTGFDYGLYYVWSYAKFFAAESLDRTDQWQDIMKAMPTLMEGVVGLAEEGGLPTLVQQCLAMPLPSPIADAQAWQHYADALFAILRDERDLGHEWNFTDDAIHKFDAYFYAHELLVECLKVAAVSDRQGILNGLLLPPDITEQAKKTRRQGDRKRRR